MKRRFPQVDASSDAYGFIVPYWTLIVTLKDGLVDTLEWDDGCYGCSGDACVDETCSVDIEAVGCRSATSTADCNPKFFIGWYGTDRNGQYLTSSGARSSRFRQYSVNSAFTAAYQSADASVCIIVSLCYRLTHWLIDVNSRLCGLCAVNDSDHAIQILVRLYE